MEKSLHNPLRQPPSPRTTWKSWLGAACVSALMLSAVRTWSPTSTGKLERVQKCAIKNLHRNTSFLDVEPIKADEFIERRDRLAKALVADGVDAFVLEPGYTFQYYGNISQQDWEPWEPEERPFLMLILPQTSPTGEIVAKTSFLAPHFEEGRVRMLGIPSRDKELDIVIWEEHWNPYKTLMESRLFPDPETPTGKPTPKPKLMMDEEIRDFIVRGLDSAGFETVALGPQADLVRQLKSPAEVSLLRAVNTGTVEAVRAMRPCLEPGLTEDEVRDVLDASLLSVGFGLFFNIVLFEEHGALPHGGFVTGWKRVTPESMIVIDVGAHYLGYSSDFCRSFFIDPPQTASFRTQAAEAAGWTSKGRTASDSLRAEKNHVWEVVFAAQTAAAHAFKANGTAADVDIAARTVIEEAGYGDAFTHRLGHGIGIKAHEPPYLNKWNTGAILKPGMTFTNEPGIYLENRFGVRHEDIYLVKEDGEAELLTGRRARGPYDP
ncbi:hypothetical protein MCOR32_009688 [Pyricularia oryzae]|nr:hypothetical protein MCOR32_009688 [Pyricularia oryzae]